MTRWILVCGGVLCGLAVLIGAFGAHALKGQLSTSALGWYDTAVSYQTTHALALIACGLLPRSRYSSLAAGCFLTGIALFSGSLYAMAASGITKLGIITPLGGLGFIAGWLFFCLAAARVGK